MTAHDFEAAIREVRPALKRHCYRMTASMQEAEDCVQEACLRAWRRLDEVREADALKPWLYSIATRVCLDALRGRKRRAAVHEEVKENATDWVEPLQDAQAGLENRETIRLAFISLLQSLPPKARAALILHEVLDWTAAEVAAGLDTTIAAARSLIQRSRARLERPPVLDPLPDQSELLSRYMAAWEARDLEGFGQLLRSDARLVMPPQYQTFVGREAIMAFFADTWRRYHGDHAFHMERVALNGQAAGVLYLDDQNGRHVHSLHLPDVSGGEVVRLTLYLPPLGPELIGHIRTA